MPKRQRKRARAVRIIDALWGGPEKFIELAHAHGTKIFLSQVDSENDLHQVMSWSIDGIMTNRIEVIGPLLDKANQ